MISTYFSTVCLSIFRISLHLVWCSPNYVLLPYIMDLTRRERADACPSDTPLAQGFSIFDGSVDITVPNVPERTNYIIARMLYSSYLTLGIQFANPMHSHG